MVITYGQEPDPAKRIRQHQGARLRQARELRGLTQAQLAQLIIDTCDIPITAQAISLWETGTSSPRPHLQVAVARALGVAPSLLFSLDAEAVA